MDISKYGSVDKIIKIKTLCARIFHNSKDFDSVKELKIVIDNTSPVIIKQLEPIIFSVFFPILKNVSESETRYGEKEKLEIVETFKILFGKIPIEKIQLFHNIYGFLLFEIYDHRNHRVQVGISEEYKLSIIDCVTALVRSLDSSVIEALYVKENTPKLSQIIFVALEMAKSEQFKKLRINTINCIMALARVLDDNDFNDVVIRNQIADVFIFYLPGVASQLRSVALIEEKHGHRIPCAALKAWGRLVCLLMQDYNAVDRKIAIYSKSDLIDLNKTKRRPWKDENELKEYIEKNKRCLEWYIETDGKLQHIIKEFSQLTHHSHHQVRLELVNMAKLLIENCPQTMSTSIGHLIDIVIVLSEDSDGEVSATSLKILEGLSEQLSKSELKTLLDNVEEGFYGVVTSMPRKFNGVDERVQVVALNSLIGYIRLLGKHNLKRVLYSIVHLNHLVLSLIHISEFDKSNISTLEDHTISDFELEKNVRRPWRQFRHFKEDVILNKIALICRLLARFGACTIICGFLLDMIVSECDEKKEAIFLLNEFIEGVETENNNEGFTILKNIIETYTDSKNWYVPLNVGIDELGYEYTLSDVQSNIIQVCLLVEALGKVALAISKRYKVFLLKTLYLILERAGNGNPVVRAAGMQALADISTACGYATRTDLISQNIDYFSFHIQRKLHKSRHTIGSLNVLAVVIKFSSRDILSSTCNVIQELLFHTYDNQNQENLNNYFYVFKMFVSGLHVWLNVEPVNSTLKTKKQKQDEYEHFKVSNVDDPNNDFSDEIMVKTAEEMFKEDMGKGKQALENEIYNDGGQYKKPIPPQYIKLTVSILGRCLHNLPSKNQARKLLVFDILETGLPILKDWEDELLPIVHQIWSPLVNRFKEFDAPLIVNCSFKLLTTLARLSKEFIRSRTAKEALPHILETLNKLAKASYLKDKGSAYRFTQNFKLQLTILRNLAHIITDLDMAEDDFLKSMEVGILYLSDKQPLPLQENALEFFSTLIKYDPSADEKLKNIFNNFKDTNEFDRNICKLGIVKVSL